MEKQNNPDKAIAVFFNDLEKYVLFSDTGKQVSLLDEFIGTYYKIDQSKDEDALKEVRLFNFCFDLLKYPHNYRVAVRQAFLLKEHQRNSLSQ